MLTTGQAAARPKAAGIWDVLQPSLKMGPPALETPADTALRRGMQLSAFPDVWHAQEGVSAEIGASLTGMQPSN